MVFTLDKHFEDYMDTMEGKKLPVVHCVKGSPGWEPVSYTHLDVYKRQPLQSSHAARRHDPNRGHYRYGSRL